MAATHHKMRTIGEDATEGVKLMQKKGTIGLFSCVTHVHPPFLEHGIVSARLALTPSTLPPTPQPTHFPGGSSAGSVCSSCIRALVLRTCAPAAHISKCGHDWRHSSLFVQ